MANLLVQKGVEVHIIAITETPLTDLRTEVCYHNGFVKDVHKGYLKKLVTYPALLRRFRRKLIEINPDIVHAFYLATHGWWAALSGVRPLVITSMGGDVSESRGAFDTIFKRALNRFAIRRADVFTVVTDDGYNQVKRHVPEVEHVFFRAGFDPGVFSAGEKPAALKCKHKLNSEFVVLSSRGFTDPNYNIETIVRAFHRLLQDEPDSKLIMLGATDTQYARDVQCLTESLNLSDHVVFCGRVKQEQMSDYYNLSDVVVSIPYDDGFPATVVESYACGKPLVVSHNSSVGEIFLDGENGFVVEPDDEVALAKKLYLLKNDIRAYKQIVEHNLECSRDHEMSTYLAGMLEIYTDLLSKVSTNSGKS